MRLHRFAPNFGLVKKYVEKNGCKWPYSEKSHAKRGIEREGKGGRESPLQIPQRFTPRNTALKKIDVLVHLCASLLTLIFRPLSTRTSFLAVEMKHVFSRWQCFLLAEKLRLS
jgi:hypothetical protein